jgi:hypothetical protein
LTFLSRCFIITEKKPIKRIRVMYSSSKKSLQWSNIGHLVGDSPAVAVLDGMIEELPIILKEIWHELVTTNTLTQGQYLLLCEMMRRTTRPQWLSTVRDSVAGWSVAGEALRIKGKTDGWYYEKHNLTSTLITRLEAGTVLIEDLAKEAPEAFFVPLFRGVKPILS